MAKRMSLVPWSTLFFAAALTFGMGGGAPLAQQNSKGDVPKAQPGANNPDLQQQKMNNSGRSVPNSSGPTTKTTPSTSNQKSDSNTSTKGGHRDYKKPHNRQTHGAQKHNPDNQA